MGHHAAAWSGTPNSEYTACLMFTAISPMLPMSFLTDCRGRYLYIAKQKKEIPIGCLPEIMLHNSFRDSSQYVCLSYSTCKNPAPSNPITATNA